MKRQYKLALRILVLLMFINAVSLSAQYCVSKSNMPWELWIKNVRFNSINSVSEKYKDYSTLGYSDFTNINTTITKGRDYELSTEAGISWSGILPNAYCRAWIDWNGNGVFEDAELVCQNTNVNPFVSSIFVPTTAVTGTVRMRTTLKSSSYATPCETFGSGEVEDYTVTIAEQPPANTPDLTVVSLNFPTNLETNRAAIFSYDVKNIGTAASAGNGLSSKIYLSTDNQFSENDLLIHEATLFGIQPNEQKTIRDTFVLSPIWTENKAYFIVKIDKDYYEINAANNLLISNVINVLIPQLNCANSLGNGTVLCYDNSTFNAINIYIAEGNLIQQKTVNKSGILLNNSTVGSLIKDSILVINNQIIKKLANGNIAFTKTITPSVLSRFSSINAAAEMTDGTFVLGGFQKLFGLINGVQFAKDSLILVNTDANLNFQDSTILFKNDNYGYISDVPNDSLYMLIPQANNGVIAVFNTSITEAITNPNLSFFKLNKIGLKLINQKNKTFNSEKLTSKIMQINTCGNAILFSTYLSFYAGKGSGSGLYNYQFNLDSLTFITQRVIGSGSTDYYGSYKVNAYQQAGILPNSYSLSSNYTGDRRIYYNNFQYIDIEFYNNGVVNFKKTVPNVAYNHIIRTGDTTCLFLTTTGEKTTIFNPDCNSLSYIPTSDLALSLTSTPSVYRQYSTQNFKILAKNIGNQAFTNIKIDFPFPTKTVNGGAVTASVGTWQEWCSGGTQCFTWTIPSLAANENATLDMPVYVLDAVNSITATTHLLSSNPVDNIASNNVASVIINRANSPLIQPLINAQLTPLNPILNQQLNPTITDNYIVVELESLMEKQIDLDIINSLGTVVLNKKIELEKGNNAFNFNVSQLPKGMYFIQTNLGNVPMKFIKF